MSTKVTKSSIACFLAFFGTLITFATVEGIEGLLAPVGLVMGVCGYILARYRVERYAKCARYASVLCIATSLFGIVYLAIYFWKAGVL